jgi:hypothetical protein
MSDEIVRTSEEEKFLGVRTKIEPPSETETAADVGEIDVQVVDDRPEEDQRESTASDSSSYDGEHEEELSNVSNRVQNRIKKLKWQYHEERRAKEQSEKLASEAVHYTQGLQTENQRLLKLIQDSQTALVQQSKDRAQASLAVAQQNFKTAHESGETDEIAAAQQALTQAQLAQAYAPSYGQQIIDNWRQQIASEPRQQTPQAQQAAPPASAPEPDPKALEWQEQNPWFGNDKEMTSLAYGVHEVLVGEQGVDPDTDQYYQLIDNRMRELFPGYFGGSDGRTNEGSLVVETASRRKANPVVAPAARNNGATPRKVTLTSTQVRLANRLGITPEMYAKQLMKENV